MKRIAALLLALALLLAGLPASASGKKVYAARNQVQVYAAKNKSSKKLGKLSYGQSVTCANYKANTTAWAKVKNANGDVGYCNMYELTAEDPNILDFTMNTASKDVAMRAKPVDSAKALVKFSKGAKVKVVAILPDGDWVRVKHMGSYGYIRAKNLTGGKKVWFTDRNIAVEDRSGNVLGTLSYGQTVYFLESRKGISLVRSEDGRLGYCYSTDFADADPCTLSETRYAIAKGVRVYSKAIATKSNAKHTLSRGTKVTVVGEDPEGQFCRVKYKGKYGYVLKNCLVWDKPAADVVAVAVTEDMDIYKDKLYGKVIASVRQGDLLMVREVKNSQAKVTTMDGKTGWTFLNWTPK